MMEMFLPGMNVGATGRYAPPDVKEAFKKHRATCGPAALAAIMELPVCAVIETFARWPGDKFPGWCSGKMMREALERLSQTYIPFSRHWPRHGLCWIQIKGPWCDPGRPYAEAMKRSHWVAVDGDYVYDINIGDWKRRADWDPLIMGFLVADLREAGAEGWEPRLGLEIVREAPLSPDQAGESEPPEKS